ncbi:MAG: methyltransferase [Deltaproteobacteria bacterium]|nr:methyltransferase [Deltaproteobacteria bacterium]MDQ3298750.1 methyltransferase [Myxococcota bacterium]
MLRTDIPGAWAAIRAALEAELGEAISIDSLTATWNIAQRVAGHRHSADDVLTAAYAVERIAIAVAVVPRAGPVAACLDRVLDRVLDLGTGIGTVGLMVLSRLGPEARLVCVEVQPISHRLLLANIAGNSLAERVEPHLGDLRELALDRRFPLITGSPPYFPLGTGMLPEDAQKAGARFELRGDVADYARAAERHLADDGVFVFCFPTPQRARALAAVAAAGLVVHAYRDVIPRETLRPLFTLFACRRAPAELHVEPPLTIRYADGRLTDEMITIRRGFGFEPTGRE